MKHLIQLGVLLGFVFTGELLHAVIPLPVPAGIYGMVLLFIALASGWLKLEHIKETADFLLQIMPAMFIPFIVALIAVEEHMYRFLLPVLVISLVTTVIVFAATGKSAEFFMRLSKRRKK